MNERIHYTHCPVCAASTIVPVLKAKDHTVSGEFFEIVQCGSCSLRFTQDVPGPASIAPYYKSEDYISHSNTAKGFINGLYHAVRKRTLERKRKLVTRTTGLSKGRFLDVGSGTGAFVANMQDHGWDATGLEPDAHARKVASDSFGVQLKNIDQFYHLPANSFNAITLWHVLEHVHELHSYIQQLKNLLTDNGRLFIAVPNYTSHDAEVYRGDWAAYDVPRHLYHFSPASIRVLMERNGLKVTEYKPMWYDSFYISLLSSRYRNGHTKWISAAWNGLRSNLKAIANVQRCSSVIYIISK